METWLKFYCALHRHWHHLAMSAPASHSDRSHEPGMSPVPTFVQTMYGIAAALAIVVFALIYHADVVLAAGEPIWPYFDMLNWPIIS
jgi:hypothetical protein